MPNTAPRRMNCHSEIGLRLRNARLAAGLSANSVGKRIQLANLPQQELECNYDQVVAVYKLCKIYGITIDQLMEGLEE